MILLKPALIGAFASVFMLTACGDQPQNRSEAAPEAVDKSESKAAKIVREDKFTYANYDEVRVTHLDLDLDVNFDEKILDGFATLEFKRVQPSASTLVLDTKDLNIDSVYTSDNGDLWEATEYVLDAADELLGSKLTVMLGADSRQVRIVYSTSPSAEGLQWLSPEQTAGKKHPYLFSQAQAINARTIAPVQDTPAVRMTYSAALRVPEGLLALMSAEQGG